MKTVSKAEFIAKIESELPDDAQIYGYSTIAGEFFTPDETGDIFVPVGNYFDEDTDRDEFVPEETTHIFEVT